jgi:hypothetical protein
MKGRKEAGALKNNTRNNKILFFGREVKIWFDFRFSRLSNLRERREMRASNYRGSCLLGENGMRDTTKTIPELYIGPFLFPRGQNL